MTDYQERSRPVYGQAGSANPQRDDRARRVRAREAAEKLFRPKPPVVQAAAPDASEDRSAHRPRVLSALPAPPPSPVTAAAPAKREGTPEIPASEFARIRAWVAYGMTVRGVAEMYAAPVEEVRRILRKA